MSIINKVKNLFSKRNKEMAPPFVNHLEKQMVIDKYRSLYKSQVLIETGTFMGDMIEAQKNNFEKLFSIELSKKLFVAAKERFANESKIKIFNGDSSTVLKEVIANTNNERLLFWLDGHYSGGVTAKGDLECPIKEELKTIFSIINEQVILIDDARLFVGKYDYPTIAELEKLINELDNNYKLNIESDIICITKIN